VIKSFIVDIKDGSLEGEGRRYQVPSSLIPREIAINGMYRMAAVNMTR